MNYKIAVDTHTHTVASAHAYSTVGELCRQANEIGLSGIAMTDHAPAVWDSPHEMHFANLRILPRKLHGVYLLKGAELSILDQNGKVDLDDSLLKRLEWVICSMHHPEMRELTFEERTNAYCIALENPYIDCVGHVGNPMFLCDYETIVKKAAKMNKVMEINNNSAVVRAGSFENCVKVAKLCKKYEVPVTVSSDAHIHTSVGDFKHAIEILKAADFPSELILNRSFESLWEYICNKRKLELEG